MAPAFLADHRVIGSSSADEANDGLLSLDIGSGGKVSGASGNPCG